MEPLTIEPRFHGHRIELSRHAPRAVRPVCSACSREMDRRRHDLIGDVECVDPLDVLAVESHRMPTDKSDLLHGTF